MSLGSPTGIVAVPQVVKKTRTLSGNNQVPQVKTSNNNSDNHNKRNKKIKYT